MRIIGGAARGRRIFSVSKNLPVKPISDRIKQSLFDILRPRLCGAIMLDLFAGTGNVSLEALSRGALKTVMADREPSCLKAMRKNLEHLGFEGRAKVLKADLLKDLSWLAAYADGEKYDIIFMGPPYRDLKNKPLNFTEGVLKNIEAASLLAKDGVIAAQHHKNEVFALPASFEIFREEKYGDTLIHFIKLKDSGVL